MSPAREAIPFLLRTLFRPRSVSREEMRAFQTRRLRRLLAHAYANVPYYRALFDRHGLQPADVRTLADLSAIPVTTKADLQGRPDTEVLARGVDAARLITRRTSGSSGRPFAIHRTWGEERILNLFRRRALHSFGYRRTDRMARVVVIRASHPNDRLPLLWMLPKIGWHRQRRVDCFQAPEAIAQALREYAPDVVAGFPTVLTRVAHAIAADPALATRPRLVVTGGEVLTPDMREDIAGAFGARVFETYASHEFNLVAWECAATGAHHTCDDGVLVEVLRDGRPAAPGERGVIVATALRSFAMPLIRFELGDIVTRGVDPCACGRPFGTIRAIQGRMVDYLRLPEGRLVHPFQVAATLRQRAPGWIRQYRLVQDRRDRVTLSLVPFGELPGERSEAIRAAVAPILGPEVELKIAVVRELPLDPSGKFRPARSLVGSDYDGVVWEAVEAGSP